MLELTTEGQHFVEDIFELRSIGWLTNLRRASIVSLFTVTSFVIMFGMIKSLQEFKPRRHYLSPAVVTNQSLKYSRERSLSDSVLGQALLCTVGTHAANLKPYPLDGICDYIVFTHVRYEKHSGNLRPTALGNAALKSWELFRTLAPGMRLTRFLPSYDWRHLIRTLDAKRARALNRTLVKIKMAGLALLNVRVPVAALHAVGEALGLLQRENSGMLLGLGTCVEGLTDTTAASILPVGLLDRLVSPLRLFVLETHLPVPGSPCRTGVPTPSLRLETQKGPFTMKGAIQVFDNPALSYVSGALLHRCISVFAGALIFNVSKASPEPGAPCRDWELSPVDRVCREPSALFHADTRGVLGHTASSVFSYESVEQLDKKLRPVLQQMLDWERPPCLVVYDIDLDDVDGHCRHSGDRDTRLVYQAYVTLGSLKMPT